MMQVAHAQNTRNQSFLKAKKNLEHIIYARPENRFTLYCNVQFDQHKNVLLPKGITITKYQSRANKIEWEYVVPVENFGRNVSAWRVGDALCVDKKGNSYKGRKCAEKISSEFRYMQADMYNIYPAIGAVNAARSNYNFTVLPHAASDFGICPMKIEGRKVEPPPYARGKIARSYLYMELTYKRYKMSSSQRKLMQTWDKQYPVTSEECQRTRTIEAIQGNENFVVKKQCQSMRLW